MKKDRGEHKPGIDKSGYDYICLVCGCEMTGPVHIDSCPACGKRGRVFEKQKLICKE